MARPKGFQCSESLRARYGHSRFATIRTRLTPPRRRLNPDIDWKERAYDFDLLPPPVEHVYTEEEILWCAVLQLALVDATATNPRVAHAARAWLLTDPDFLLVADYAGIADPANMRAVLRRHLPAPAIARPLPWRARPTLLTGELPLAA